MRVFKKKSKGSQVSRDDALNSIPVKNTRVSESRLDGGEILIHYPIKMRPWIAPIVKRFGGSRDEIRYRKLQLDEMGTEVWTLIDGNRSVSRIIQEFARAHQLQTREAEVAVTQFMRELGRRGVIGLR